ncbi:hypothetical protein TcWFU_001892 [Taenia crassiceps]|uniref:Uncharacterized protein n=1 Tax=Taenia crassiceps TaxID=6207 RepID=A0ABR4Q5K0_9CEST
MITRNRGKSKSVVETLGLVKKNKRRVAKEGDLAKTGAALLPLAHEEVVSEAEEKVSRGCDGGSNLGVTVDVTDCCRLGELTVSQPAFRKCEDSLGTLHKVPGYDWLPPKGTHSFRVCDEVLREILEEVSAAGEVFLSRRQFMQSKLRRNESREKEENVVYAFKETRLQRLFGKMSVDLETINEELDKEEAFLAPCGLVRPGVTRALRKRRLEKCKQVKHEAMGRLRPNPRPRRFSDMVNPSGEVAARLTGISRNAKRVRDRNARAAAKKLAQAKSQASHMLQSNTEVKRGRPRKSSRPLMESNKRSISRSGVQTRPRRSVSTRHHIDWKFCYGSVSENMKLQRGGEVATTRKRRAPVSSHTSADENEEEEEEEAESKEHKRGLEQTRNVEGEAEHETGVVRCEGIGAGAEISFPKSVAGAALQESNVPRGSDLRRCARSMLFERKRRRNVLRLAGARSRSRSRSSSELSTDFDGGARCYTRRAAVASQSREASFVVGQRKKGSSFYARPSRVFATARNAAVSTTVGGAEEHMERVRGGHHHRRLTLLDRVVLGLTCSVMQDGDEIHIKQLHSDDLSILLQRVTETGFNINGLSTKTNANSEQEFNITLTHHPRAEMSVRQVRKHNISGAQSSASATTLASHAFRGAQALSPTPVAAVGGGAGAAGDTVCLDTHSDSEGGLKGRGVVVCDSPPSLRPSSTMGFNRSRMLSVAARRRGVQSGGGRMLHPLHRMGMRHLSAAAAAAAAAAVARSSGGVARRPRSRDSNAAEGDSDGGEAVPHAHQSHHAASPFVLPLAGGLGFRRHSPRKVIRKVYTGTSTVPKILNRRRLLIAGSTHLPPQQASQPLASPFPLPQPAVTMATAGVKMSVSTGGSGAEELVVAATAENKSSQPFSRVYGPVAIEAVTAEALVESSEKSKRASRGLGEEVVHTGSSATGAVAGSSGGSVSEVVATTIAVASTTVTAAGATLQSLPPSEEEGRKNPANSMCASQLLRLKRHHDEQPQLSSVPTSSSMEAVSPTSLPPPPPLPPPQVCTPSPSLPSSQSLQKNQRKLNPIQQRVEVAGLASTVDIDDGTDFELSTALIHPPPLQPAAPSGLPTAVHQTLPMVAKANEPLEGLRSVLSSASTSTATTSTMAYLHQQCCNASQYSAAVVQCVASAGVLSQGAKNVATGKRPLIPAVNATTASVPPTTTQHTFDVCGKAGFLTGRPMIAPGRGVVSTVAATTSNKRPVVHKYHTFRKISPKNQTTSFVAVDSGATITITTTATTTTTITTTNNNSVNSSSIGRPATSSLLLKSLLESGGGGALPNAHSSYQPRAPSAPPPLSAPPPPLPPPPPPSLRAHASALCGSSLSVAAARFNQPPAHQSRGTWQLGGRAIVIGASITTPSNSTHRLQSLPVTPSPSPPATPPPPTSIDGGSTAKSVEAITSDAVPHPVLHETVGS